MNPDEPEIPADSSAEPGAVPDDLVQSDTPPAHLDYECIRLIGCGGYGQVWLVRDQSGCHRACKVIYRESFDSDRPYEREYEGIKKFEPVSLTNESQVQILHVGRRDEAGYFYYIMELADDATTGQEINPDHYVARTLKTELNRRGRLPSGECLRLGLSLSAALANLHEHGLIHRDIKPANIIFIHGIPKLADIGLVTDADVTVSYVGTEGYIPPEGPGSAPADVYGLGKVLYEMSTGRDRLDFPELPTGLGEMPDHDTLLELNAVVTRACANDVRKRYQSAAQLHADLTLLANGTSVRQRRKRDQSRALATRISVVLAVLLLALFGFVALQKHWTQNRSSVPTTENANRIEPPPAAEVSKKEIELRKSYGDRLSSGNIPNRLEIVRELLQRSATAADPVVGLASLRLAATLAVEAEDFHLAMEVCATMTARFRLDPLSFKLELLKKAGAYARTPESGATLSEVCVAAGFEGIASDEYAPAVEFTGLARNAAKFSGIVHLPRLVDFLESEIKRCEPEYVRVKPSLEILQTQPGDPKASLAVGKFLCLVKNDWESGLPMLVRGNDGSFKEVLENEINRKPGTPENLVASGDAWWNLSDTGSEHEKVYFQRRARYWYMKALVASREPEKSSLRHQLDDRIKAIPPQSGQVHIVSRVDGTERIEMDADGITWKSSHSSIGDQINHILIGELKIGGSASLKNCGATRLFPEGVDFATARLIIDHKGKRRGRALLETAEDHVQVIMSDPPIGSSELEVTVTFGE